MTALWLDPKDRAQRLERYGRCEIVGWRLADWAIGVLLAPRRGLEPRTLRLTAACSTD